MELKRHCQMHLQPSGVLECGYLIGNICKADRDHPVTITKQIHDALKVVGCQSWSRYLEWNDRKNEVPELPVKQVGDCRDSPTLTGSIEGRLPVPMHVLQEGGTCNGRHTNVEVSTGCNMIPCDICGKQSIVKESDGHNYCEEHHVLWTKCWTHQRMLLTYKEEK